MVIGERIRQRMTLLGLSASAVAREAGVSQPTIFRLMTGKQYGSTRINAIARALLTTVEYLTGETDDPDENAPLPPPAPAPAPLLLSMKVVFPPTIALEEMFGGMLDVIGEPESKDALARQLAQLLPRALSRLKDLRLDWGVPPVQIEASPEFDAVPPSADPVHQQ